MHNLNSLTSSTTHPTPSQHLHPLPAQQHLPAPKTRAGPLGNNPTPFNLTLSPIAPQGWIQQSCLLFRTASIFFFPSGLEHLYLLEDRAVQDKSTTEHKGRRKGFPNGVIQRKRGHAYRRARGARQTSYRCTSLGKLTDLKARLNLSISGSPSIFCTTSFSLYYTRPLDTLHFLSSIYPK